MKPDHKTRKGQSAIEYLTTYGWMLLVIAIVGGAIFQVATQSKINNVDGFQSEFVGVSEFGITPSGLKMNIKDKDPRGSYMKAITVSQTENKTATISLTEKFGLEGKTINLPYMTSSEDRNTLKVDIIYNKGSLNGITTTGSISGNIKFDEDFVGYWTLSKENGNSTHVFDLSHLNDDGDIEGASYAQDPEKGSIMTFDGEDDRIKLTGDRGSTFTDEITVYTWAKTNQSNWVLGEGALFRMSLNPGGSAKFWVREENFGNSNTVSGGSIKDNKWHNIVGRFDAETGKQTLFVDGEKVASERTNYDALGDKHENLCIGEAYCGSGSFFNGSITNVRIFNRPLSQKEIRSMYQQPQTIY